MQMLDQGNESAVPRHHPEGGGPNGARRRFILARSINARGGHTGVDHLMDRLHDPTVLALPHPVLVDAALGVPIESILDRRGRVAGPTTAPVPGSASVTRAWLLHSVPELARWAGASAAGVKTKPYAVR
jgi:hypothetical protein